MLKTKYYVSGWVPLNQNQFELISKMPSSDISRHRWEVLVNGNPYSNFTLTENNMVVQVSVKGSLKAGDVVEAYVKDLTDTLETLDTENAGSFPENDAGSEILAKWRNVGTLRHRLHFLRSNPLVALDYNEAAMELAINSYVNGLNYLWVPLNLPLTDGYFEPDATDYKIFAVNSLMSGSGKNLSDLDNIPETKQGAMLVVPAALTSPDFYGCKLGQSPQSYVRVFKPLRVLNKKYRYYVVRLPDEDSQIKSIEKGNRLKFAVMGDLRLNKKEVSSYIVPQASLFLDSIYDSPKDLINKFGEGKEITVPVDVFEGLNEISSGEIAWTEGKFLKINSVNSEDFGGGMAPSFGAIQNFTQVGRFSKTGYIDEGYIVVKLLDGVIIGLDELKKSIPQVEDLYATTIEGTQGTDYNMLFVEIGKSKERVFAELKTLQDEAGKYKALVEYSLRGVVQEGTLTIDIASGEFSFNLAGARNMRAFFRDSQGMFQCVHRKKNFRLKEDSFLERFEFYVNYSDRQVKDLYGMDASGEVQVYFLGQTLQAFSKNAPQPSSRENTRGLIIKGLFEGRGFAGGDYIDRRDQFEKRNYQIIHADFYIDAHGIRSDRVLTGQRDSNVFKKIKIEAGILGTDIKITTQKEIKEFYFINPLTGTSLRWSYDRDGFSLSDDGDYILHFRDIDFNKVNALTKLSLRGVLGYV